MVELQAPDLVKFYIKGHQLLKRLMKDIMGYGGPMKYLPPQIRWGKDNEEKGCLKIHTQQSYCE